STPQFNWNVPLISTHNSQSIGLYDLEDALQSTGDPPQIFQTNLSNSARSFDVSTAVPGGLLLPNHRYSVAVQLDDRASNGRLLSRSRSFFDFSTSNILVPGVGPVILPSVDPTGSPNGGPIYQFNVGPTIAGETIFIDPFVAVGYEFNTGVNDENFASVVLPNIGDGNFLLSFFDGTNNIVEALTAQSVYAFPTGGVSAFTVTGIETSAGLDPTDATAFATGISFVANSTFTGTMTPITQFVDASVPEPSTVALFALSLASLAYVRRRTPLVRRTRSRS
nr:PEP-CTERM sorting domain-containing protein [Gammaproteobacteria bacterium]